jgi:hypothetical protein
MHKEKGNDLRRKIGYLAEIGKPIDKMPLIDEKESINTSSNKANELYQSVMRAFYIWDEELKKGILPHSANSKMQERLDRIRIKYTVDDEEFFNVV